MPMRTAITPQDAGRIAEYIEGLPLPFTITVSEGEIRTVPQNSLFHQWMQELADQHGDLDEHDMKGICHREFGLPIRLQDEVFGWVWEKTGANLSYEKQCKLLASGALGLSSGMTTPQMKAYMDTIQRKYTEKGFRLTDPELRKYEGAS